MSPKFWFCLVFSLLLSREASSQLAWREPVRISGYNLLTPRAVAVGDTIHVVGNSNPFKYIRSTDGGLTWQVLPTPADTFYAADMPDIIASKGKIHLLWIGYHQAPWSYHIYHASSSDGGTSWSLPHRVFYNRSSFLKYPRLAANGDSLAASCAISSHFLCFRSLNGGLSWQDSAQVAGPANISCDQTLIVSEGRLIMVFQLSFSGDSLGEEIYCRSSPDWGLSWGERLSLSTLETLPDYRHSLFPSGYGDMEGNALVAWFDYKYGSMCGFSGDILARISHDGGQSWGPEMRLTFSQSGEASSCLIWRDTAYVCWMDDLPLGCSHPKLCLSVSGDWGGRWNWPEVISGLEPVTDMEPVIFRSYGITDSVLHCVFRRREDFQPSYLYYTRGHAAVSAVEEEEAPDMPGELRLKAYPNPFNSSTTITLSGMAEAEIAIYDITGRRLEVLQAHDGRAVWEASALSSGVYFARVLGEGSGRALRLVLVR